MKDSARTLPAIIRCCQAQEGDNRVTCYQDREMQGPAAPEPSRSCPSPETAARSAALLCTKSSRFQKVTSFALLRGTAGKGDAGPCTKAGVGTAKPGSTPIAMWGFTVLVLVLRAAKPTPTAKSSRGAAFLPGDGSTCRRTGRARCQAQHPPAPKKPPRPANKQGLMEGFFQQLPWQQKALILLSAPRRCCEPHSARMLHDSLQRNSNILVSKIGFSLKKKKNQTGMWFLGITPIWHWKVHAL